MHGTDYKCMQYFGWKIRREENPWNTCKWEDKIKIDHKEIGWEGLNGIHSAQGMDQWQILLNMVIY
jgi:hypothetical protein